MEEDQRGSEGYKFRLKKENSELKARYVHELVSRRQDDGCVKLDTSCLYRLEEYEDMLRDTEQASKKAVSESQERLRSSVVSLKAKKHTDTPDLAPLLHTEQDEERE